MTSCSTAYCGTNGGIGPLPSDPDSNLILTVKPAFGGIDVLWTWPQINGHAVAYTIIYRSTNADFTTAVVHHRSSSDFYYDRVNPEQNIEYFYWIRWVSINGTEGELIGPASAIARPTVEQTIEMLTGQITAGVLAQALKEELQRIDGLNMDLGSEIAARLAQYDAIQADLVQFQNDVTGLATIIANDVQRLEDADTAQINQINVLGAKTDSNEAMIIQESQARANADSALAQTIETLQASSANKFYQDTPPDPAVVILQEGDIWVDTTEPVDGSEPQYLLHQWDGIQWVLQDPNTLAGLHAAIEAEKLARVGRDGALASSVSTLEASVGRKSRTYFQANPPVAENVGDLWIDTDNNNALFYWDGPTNGWVDGWDRRISQTINDLSAAQQAALDAMNAAQQAQATADGAIRTYYQGTPPTGLNNTTDLGDLWFDTMTDQAYRWSGTEFVLIQDNGIAEALAAAEGAQITADGKITTFYQPDTQIPSAEGDGDVWIVTNQQNRLRVWSASEGVWKDARDTDIAVGVGRNQVFRQAVAPTAENIGDLWVDTDNNNQLYYWTGTQWVDAWDQRIITALNGVVNAQASANSALTAAQMAQATADNAIRTHYSPNPPTGLNSTTDIGDLWFDTMTDQAYRWSGTEFVLIQDNGIAEALAAAQSAQVTADGKVTTFYQPSTQVPTAEGNGDIWVVTDQQNRMRLWQETSGSWVDARDTDIAVGVSRNQVFHQATTPTASNEGDLWFDSGDDDRAYEWRNNSWVPLNLFTGNQVSAAITEYDTARVGFCMINGSPDATKEDRDACVAAKGTWLNMYAIAEAVKGVQITDGDGETANVEQRMQAYKDDIGNLNGQYTVKVQTDSMGTQYVGGFGLATQGQTVEAGFDVDRFWVGKLQPDGSITGGKLPLIIEGNEVFINEAVIRQLAFEKLRSADGNLVVDSTTGKIKVDYMDVTNMSVRQAQSDNYSAGVNGWRFSPDGSFQMHSAATGGRIQHVGDRIDVYDENNTLRVRIGRL